MLAASVAAAQNPSPTQAPTPGNSQQRPAERRETGTPRVQTDQQVTLVGCVAREGANDIILNSAVPTGTSGNAASGVAGATPTAPAATSGAAAGGTTAAATAGATASKYRLSGERDLDQFIGQRVEIVGRMDPSAASNTASASAGSSTTTPAPAAPSAGATADAKSSTAGAAGASSATATAAIPRVTITSVRAMGGSCL
jgi:hypothetical protein